LIAAAIAVRIGASGGKEVTAMKLLQVELSDKLEALMAALVQEGWFRSADEVIQVALIEFLRRRRFDLLEKQQREDIAWALRQKGTSP
jgi:Arc/MetJ-type ribon-helix-helix transcriptional regulator